MAEKKLVSRELCSGDEESDNDEWCITIDGDGLLHLRPVFRDACGERFVARDREFMPATEASSEFTEPTPLGWQEILRTLLAAWSPKPEPEEP